MNLPGFTAEVALDQASQRNYKNWSIHTGAGKQTILPQVMIGRGGLPFSCDRTECECVGEEDCFDLTQTGLCKPENWTCEGDVCTCKRK